ncbi:hypothetical protein N9194_00245 [bacterium]|nr:hypothetical protein [bacterium]
MSYLGVVMSRTQFLKKQKPVSPGPTPTRGGGNSIKVGEFQHELKMHERMVLNWTLLVISIVTGVSFVGSYFSKFIEVPGSDYILFVGLVGFVFVHVIAVVSGWTNNRHLKFSRWSVGIVWFSLALILFLRLIEAL